MKLILLFALIVPVAVAGQTKSYKVDLYTHPGVNPNIQYATPLVQQPSPQVVYRQPIIINRRPRAKKNKLADQPNLHPMGVRNWEGKLRYEKYNTTTREFEISDSTGKIVEYLISYPKKINILDSARIWIGYFEKKGKYLKRYDVHGKFVRKVKIH